MKPASFEYHDPATLDEALDLMAEYADQARPLAGGQSLVPLMKLRLAAPSLAHKGAETAVMSACIIAAQLVMLPMALLVGAKADVWGRKPIFLAGFGILPIRGVLYTLSAYVPLWMMAHGGHSALGAGVALVPLLTGWVFDRIVPLSSRISRVSRGATASASLLSTMRGWIAWRLSSS